MDQIANDLRFPEGPISLPDGSVVVVEIEAGDLTRVHPDGSKTVIAHCGGGPNGAAPGPDGCYYVANDGGFGWAEHDGYLVPTGRAEDYIGGRIQRVDPRTNTAETIYDSCDGSPLNAPNDLVFDADGGFYFTDTGTSWQGKVDVGAVYYAKADGSSITKVLPGLDRPNGIAMSPDLDRLYVVESLTSRIWWWQVDAPGVLRPGSTPFAPAGGTLLYVFDQFCYLDSFAVDAEGSVCVGTLVTGGVSRISADGKLLDFFPVPDHDPLVTNVCFDISDRSKAYVTSSGLGRLYSFEWPCAGARLAYEAEL